MIICMKPHQLTRTGKGIRFIRQTSIRGPRTSSKQSCCFGGERKGTLPVMQIRKENSNHPHLQPHHDEDPAPSRSGREAPSSTPLPELPQFPRTQVVPPVLQPSSSQLGHATPVYPTQPRLNSLSCQSPEQTFWFPYSV